MLLYLHLPCSKKEAGGTCWDEMLNYTRWYPKNICDLIMFYPCNTGVRLAQKGYQDYRSFLSLYCVVLCWIAHSPPAACRLSTHSSCLGILHSHPSCKSRQCRKTGNHPLCPRSICCQVCRHPVKCDHTKVGNKVEVWAWLGKIADRFLEVGAAHLLVLALVVARRVALPIGAREGAGGEHVGVVLVASLAVALFAHIGLFNADVLNTVLSFESVIFFDKKISSLLSRKLKKRN